MADAYRHYVDGEWTTGSGEETFESTNPATGETLGEFHRGTPEDIEHAFTEPAPGYTNIEGGYGFLGASHRITAFTVNL